MNLEKFYPNLTPAAARRSQQLSLPLLSFSLKKRRATVKTPIYIGFACVLYWGVVGKILKGTDLTEIPIEWMSAT